MDDSLITVKEVADYLKLKEQTVYLLARQNKIPSLKVGGSLRFKKSQIDAWLQTAPKEAQPEGTRQKVLIVDDEELVRGTLESMIDRCGIGAVAAASGFEAIEKVRQDSFRMVFLDLNMPGMNGVETLKELKQIDHDLVFVIITALSGDDDLFRDVLEYAPVSVIPKPFTLQQISELLRIYFEDAVKIPENQLI
jgi:two-component system response regulator (stage 0 sporulation protein F)